MQKEDNPKHITEEQRARISQNFRAAKALLERKRPLCVASSVSPIIVKQRPRIPVDAQGVKRLPLFEISPNTPINSRLIQNVGSSALKNCLTNETTGENSASFLPCLDGIERTDVFKTPSKEQGYWSPRRNCSPSTATDDDESFDNDILREIDAICEQESAGRVHQELDQNADVYLEINCERDNCCNSPDIDPIITCPSGRTLNNLGSFNVCHFAKEDVDDTSLVNLKTVPEKFKSYWDSLNAQQREASCSEISIPLMITAGPGSGKTSTMVGRILMLLHEGICASNILAMTFTSAAASEMRERIATVAGKTIAKELTVSTFHSFALQLCRKHAEKIRRTSEFSIYGRGQQRRAIIESIRLVEKEKLDDQKLDVDKDSRTSDAVIHPENFKDKCKKWETFVTKAKASGKSVGDFTNLQDSSKAAILKQYNNILESCDAMDYHDLISYSVKLLSDFSEVFQECQKLWKCIIIDEFQDTSTMQYNLLRLLASHNRITVVGDDDQSIFSFNGADLSGFDSFRKDFANHEEVRLNTNYRSTRYIVEGASCVIQNNFKNFQSKDIVTNNDPGSKITIKECHNEHAQCSFVIDKVVEMALDGETTKPSYSKFAILYRKQTSGKLFQSVFRERKIPFNVHGVAFYRKKVVKIIMSMLMTALPDCDDVAYRRVFKTLLPFEKEETKKVVEYIDKISASRKCSFMSVASDIFGAKISGTLKRNQITQGRKVLLTLDMISKLVRREQSISAVITSVTNLIPQKYLLEQRAVVDVDGRKYLNEDNDTRSILQFLLDDVSNFLSNQPSFYENDIMNEAKGCIHQLKAFVDCIRERERENYSSRRSDNDNSVTLTTIHQSKGLEWDTVFIVKANETEIPLLHEFDGISMNRASIEEERRLFYVAMTRAKTKLFILFVAVDSNWQMLQPSRFLKEIPDSVREIQAEVCLNAIQLKNPEPINIESNGKRCSGKGSEPFVAPGLQKDSYDMHDNEALDELTDSYHGNIFLKCFSVEGRPVVSHLFRTWAKKQAFQNPDRLLVKVRFIIDERLRSKKDKHKDVLRELKTHLNSDEALQYAKHVLMWEKIPADQRAFIMREKQEHFQKLRIENSMSSSAPTTKQISYLQKLGCTTTPTSRLHASNLIEQYKAL